MSTLRLNTGDLRVASSGDILVTGGVGSCVVICIWDPTAQLGGMAHVCNASSDGNILFPGRSAETAVPTLINLLIKQGASPLALEVKLAGGGNMFSGIEIGTSGDVGFHIANATRRTLQLFSLNLVEHSLGGRLGRAVSFCLTTGQVDVRFTNGQSLSLTKRG